MRATKKGLSDSSNQNETWKILDKTKHYSGQAMRVLDYLLCLYYSIEIASYQGLGRF